MFRIHLINYIAISCSNFRYINKVQKIFYDNRSFIDQKWKKSKIKQKKELDFEVDEDEV